MAEDDYQERSVILTYYRWFLTWHFLHVITLFNSPGQRPCELLPSLGVRRLPSVRPSIVSRRLGRVKYEKWHSERTIEKYFLLYNNIHLLHAGEGNMKIYSPKSIIFPEGCLPSVRPSYVVNFNLLRNHWANCSQTLVEWYLYGPLPKLCPLIPTSNQDGHQAKNRKKGGWNFNCCSCSYNLSSFWLILKQQWTIEENYIFNNSSLLEWRAGLSDTILKGTHPGTIPTRFGLLWDKNHI
jgi:hypothetical protein